MNISVFKISLGTKVKQEIPVTSVVLERNDDPDEVSMFFCPKCGNSIIQHKGRIAFILPGQTPCNMPLIAQCRKCKTRYMFRTNL